MNCKVCTHDAQPFARAQVLHKYDVQYYRCPACGFIQTEEPFWLDEAYSSAISDLDLGTVNRSVTNAKITRSLLLTYYDCNAKFIDFGGGYGLFVRMMRDKGFDFYRSDKYADNILAKGFDADGDNQTHYELGTAFEVFEHLVDPLGEIERMLRSTKNILFSTFLVPDNVPQPGEWWYYTLEHGQHVALYTRESLALLAKRFGLHLYTDGTSLHLLTNKRLPSFILKAIQRFDVATVLVLLNRRRQRTRSLLLDDWNRVTGWDVH